MARWYTWRSDNGIFFKIPLLVVAVGVINLADWVVNAVKGHPSPLRDLFLVVGMILVGSLIIWRLDKWDAKLNGGSLGTRANRQASSAPRATPDDDQLG